MLLCKHWYRTMIKVRNLWRTFTRDRCQRHGTQFEYSRFRTEKFKKNSVRVPRLIINLFSRKETQFPFSLILSKLLQVKLNQNINILNFVLSDKLIFCYFFNSHFFNCPKFIIHSTLEFVVECFHWDEYSEESKRLEARIWSRYRLVIVWLKRSACPSYLSFWISFKLNYRWPTS